MILMIITTRFPSSSFIAICVVVCTYSNSSSSSSSSTGSIITTCDFVIFRAKQKIRKNSWQISIKGASHANQLKEEEIDVVSINDKKLPTNPSDKDRRALQNKVAHKFNARIIKNANGLRTIPPRRRGSYEFPYTPASSSPVKSVNNSRYPSPASTPYQSQYTTKYVQQQQQLMTVIDKSADTIEKRHLHNDMERQRRIGLKNLFEALKKQIPSIKDKERAPKVNILREAAKLCEALTSEDQQLTEQKARLREELRKRQERLTMLRAQRARRLGGGLID
ncbi:hypothetical protein GQX74_007063 [Glossina fuscipes]|nr:hypothetical protein GQX74_007063 [Glossina fuscipes]